MYSQKNAAYLELNNPLSC